jgi:hypothetical protein
MVALLHSAVAYRRTLLESVLGYELIWPEQSKEVGAEDHLAVHIRLRLLIECRVVQMVEFHTGLALDGFHGRLMDDISDMRPYIRFLLQPEHCTELPHISSLENIHIDMQQFLTVRQQFFEEQLFKSERCIATAYFGLAWGKKYFHANLFRWYIAL